jgi:hypothetical protein
LERSEGVKRAVIVAAPAPATVAVDPEIDITAELEEV